MQLLDDVDNFDCLGWAVGCATLEVRCHFVGKHAPAVVVDLECIGPQGHGLIADDEEREVALAALVTQVGKRRIDERDHLLTRTRLRLDDWLDIKDVRTATVIVDVDIRNRFDLDREGEGRSDGEGAPLCCYPREHGGIGVRPAGSDNGVEAEQRAGAELYRLGSCDGSDRRAEVANIAERDARR